jgi:hypothetical protein
MNEWRATLDLHLYSDLGEEATATRTDLHALDDWTPQVAPDVLLLRNFDGDVSV